MTVSLSDDELLFLAPRGAGDIGMNLNRTATPEVLMVALWQRVCDDSMPVVEVFNALPPSSMSAARTLWALC